MTCCSTSTLKSFYTEERHIWLDSSVNKAGIKSPIWPWTTNTLQGNYEQAVNGNMNWCEVFSVQISGKAREKEKQCLPLDDVYFVLMDFAEQNIWVCLTNTAVNHSTRNTAEGCIALPNVCKVKSFQNKSFKSRSCTDIYFLWPAAVVHLRRQQVPLLCLCLLVPPPSSLPRKDVLSV